MSFTYCGRQMKRHNIVLHKPTLHFFPNSSRYIFRQHVLTTFFIQMRH